LASVASCYCKRPPKERGPRGFLLFTFDDNKQALIMDPKMRRWLIALVIGIALFVVGMAGHYLNLL